MGAIFGNKYVEEKDVGSVVVTSILIALMLCFVARVVD